MRNPWLKALAVGLVLAWTGGLAVGGERDMARARGLFAQAQRGIKLEASAAHIKLGIWCRDAGLPPQATAEFLRAVEVSEGQHPLAIKLVDIMLAWGDKFWKYVQKKPKAITAKGRPMVGVVVEPFFAVGNFIAKKTPLTQSMSFSPFRSVVSLTETEPTETEPLAVISHSNSARPASAGSSIKLRS